ncbi:uncharacterized protein LOC119169809 isoform X1 [Rhipicephalus microplus]|uniref:uncharacterized protein LOC119169809 isoform X1 n=1 Tax=Rhipicephalus microplus TaxID=6941 RepID=UPI003F6B2C88
MTSLQNTRLDSVDSLRLPRACVSCLTFHWLSSSVITTTSACLDSPQGSESPAVFPEKDRLWPAASERWMNSNGKQGIWKRKKYCCSRNPLKKCLFLSHWWPWPCFVACPRRNTAEAGSDLEASNPEEAMADKEAAMNMVEAMVNKAAATNPEEAMDKVAAMNREAVTRAP